VKGVRTDTGEMVDIGPAHPVADLFPMLAGEDLDELTASIQEQGLLQPVVLDEDGRVLDGRNRLAACEPLGVTPEVVIYDGDDPDGYALTVNLARRHLSKGQRAMLAAQAADVTGQTQREVAAAQKLSTGRVGQAATVLDHAPDLANAVVAGARSLDDAYKEAQDRKRAATDAEAQIAKLLAEAPDIAIHVIEDGLPLNEAMGQYRARVEEDRRQRRVATDLLCQNVVTVAQFQGGRTGYRYDPDLVLPGRAVTRQVLETAGTAIEELLFIWEERGLP
jgi:ParB/RepB/Spo0J family partition protein